MKKGQMGLPQSLKILPFQNSPNEIMVQARHQKKIFECHISKKKDSQPTTVKNP